MQLAPSLSSPSPSHNMALRNVRWGKWAPVPQPWFIWPLLSLLETVCQPIDTKALTKFRIRVSLPAPPWHFVRGQSSQQGP
jgi:hypothetical protein